MPTIMSDKPNDDLSNKAIVEKRTLIDANAKPPVKERYLRRGSFFNKDSIEPKIFP